MTASMISQGRRQRPYADGAGQRLRAPGPGTVRLASRAAYLKPLATYSATDWIFAVDSWPSKAGMLLPPPVTCATIPARSSSSWMFGPDPPEPSVPWQPAQLDA